MNNKFYISLEAARLLKEKGYNEEVELFYNTLGELMNVSDLFCCEVADNTQMAKYYYLSAPSKAETIDWLESKGIMIEITIDIDECEWIFNIVDKEKFITIGHPRDGEFFTDRLEAEEAAIIKALELL